MTPVYACNMRFLSLKAPKKGSFPEDQVAGDDILPSPVPSHLGPDLRMSLRPLDDLLGQASKGLKWAQKRCASSKHVALNGLQRIGFEALSRLRRGRKGIQVSPTTTLVSSTLPPLPMGVSKNCPFTQSSVRSTRN